MTGIVDSAWDLLHPDVRSSAKAIVATGKHDDAIFAAYRLIEATLQERLHSQSIGQALVVEAFDGPTPGVDIAKDSRDRESIRQLFSGALGHIRNDRGHKRSPSIPCPDTKICFQYLATASLLLFYLEQDRNLWPTVDGVRLFGTLANPTLEIRGEHLDRVSVVQASEKQVPSTLHSPSLLEIALPRDFRGVVQLMLPSGEPIDIPCDTRALSEQPESVYEVIAADVPLFADAECRVRREDVVGLLLRANEGGGRSFTRIQPTIPGRYRAGQFVTHGPFDQTCVAESWYQEPNSGTPQTAWSGSLVATPDVIGESGLRRNISIHILPGDIRLGPDERRSLRVRAFYVDGPASGEMDVTGEVSWSTSAERVAYVKDGVLFAKAFGEAQIEARWAGLVSKARVRTAALVRGAVIPYFQGIRRLQQLAFDQNDHMYFVNQSESVFRISSDGKFSEVARLDMGDSEVYGIDCVHVTSDNALYLSTVSQHQCLRLRLKGGRFENPEPVAPSIRGVKKGIASDTNGRVFIAVMGNFDGGQIVTIDPDGRESVFRTPDMAIYLTVGIDGRLYVPSSRLRAVHVFSPEGELVEEIPYEISDSPAGIVVDRQGAILVPFFSSGKLLRISCRGNSTAAEFIADGLGTPGGIAVDSKGRVFVSDFSGDSIRMIV